MKLLALDTSTEFCSAALWLDGAIAAEGVHAGQRHSELLLPMIDRLLAQAQIVLRALDAIAFGAGPGSFTGLRIACGVTQGLAFGAGLPVVGIGTLAALAEASAATESVCCLDARMKEVYFAAYRRTAGTWQTVHSPGLYSPQRLPQLPQGKWIGCGNAFAVYPDALAHSLGERLHAVSSVSVPHAREIATLAAVELAQGRTRPAEEALPLYIRDKVALTIEEQP
ncbi:MAG: tRNA (adenosine(37)-N6)-threonylcarbamoyltransferase complex dimerization subunit type 1 TsaB [Betaproteobacteria bacterium]|nr:MAG: tRNA (adenosine(37)-N6)-threonylcarbamoyltransferase complex dimerization subunit type 1 TsaB [Betaproteobacteria bacterium]